MTITVKVHDVDHVAHNSYKHIEEDCRSSL